MADTPTSEDSPPPALPPAGWYPDARDTQMLRWWDGSSWDSATRPRRAPSAQEFQPVVNASVPSVAVGGVEGTSARSGFWGRRLAVSAALVGGLILVGAAVVLWGSLRHDSPGTNATTFRTTGTVTVDGSTLMDRAVNGNECITTGGFDDIRAGTQVVLSDDAGETLVIGELEAGVLVGVREGHDGFLEGPWPCSFTFTLEGIPDIDGYYTLTVGQRGDLKYSRSQLDEPLSLTLN
jgi:Protein of unknown function (DUF2510)